MGITGVIPVEVDSDVISVVSTFPQPLGDKQLEAEETGKESQTRTRVPGMGKESADYGRSKHGMSDHQSPGI